MRVLLAEDDYASAKAVDIALTKAGHEVVVAPDGVQAEKSFASSDFDLLLTDWMMPRMDGIELIHRVRDSVKPTPIIVMITAIGLPHAREHAMEAGADEYITKPCGPLDVVKTLERCIARHTQPPPSPPSLVERPAAPASATVMAHAPSPVTPWSPAPPFAGVLVAASTGGPDAIRTIVRSLDSELPAAFFLVQHGPPWMMETLARSLQNDTSLTVHLAEDGMQPAAGELYVAAGDAHMEIDAGSRQVRLTDDPPENYMRPAADPLLRSGARAFGDQTLAVVLTGMGRDGAQGAAAVIAAGGTVLVQDPATTVATGMPKTVIDLGLASRVAPLDEVGQQIIHRIKQMRHEA